MSATGEGFPSGAVLVTGGTGFIGSHLVRALVARGHEVHVAQRPGSDPWRLAEVAARVTLRTADLRARATLERTVAEVSPAVVFHLAGDTELRRLEAAHERVRASVEEGLLGALDLVLALRAHGSTRVLVRLGGLEEYGRGAVPYREDQREAPVSPYSASQVALTHYLAMLQPVLPFEAVTLRPALVYGPAQSERFLVPALIRACLEQRAFDLSTGTQTRDLLYVEDLVGALLAAAATRGLGGEVLNLGGGVEHVVGDVARTIRRLCASRSELRFGALPARASEIQRLVCDSTRAAERLGWRATTALEDGLARTIAWYRARGAPG